MMMWDDYYDSDHVIHSIDIRIQFYHLCKDFPRCVNILCALLQMRLPITLIIYYCYTYIINNNVLWKFAKSYSLDNSLQSASKYLNIYLNPCEPFFHWSFFPYKFLSICSSWCMFYSAKDKDFLLKNHLPMKLTHFRFFMIFLLLVPFIPLYLKHLKYLLNLFRGCFYRCFLYILNFIKPNDFYTLANYSMSFLIDIHFL